VSCDLEILANCRFAAPEATGKPVVRNYVYANPSMKPARLSLFNTATAKLSDFDGITTESHKSKSVFLRLFARHTKRNAALKQGLRDLLAVRAPPITPENRDFFAVQANDINGREFVPV
jgi:hypothetical protein